MSFCARFEKTAVTLKTLRNLWEFGIRKRTSFTNPIAHRTHLDKLIKELHGKKGKALVKHKKLHDLHQISGSWADSLTDLVRESTNSGKQRLTWSKGYKAHPRTVRKKILATIKSVNRASKHLKGKTS